jgi:HEAT repeat protein
MKTRPLLSLLLSLVACQGDRGALLAALASPDPLARSAAVQKLAARKDPNDLGYLIGRVSDPDPLVRESVARALGEFDDRRATEALAKLVSDSAESVEIVAVKSLAGQKSPRAFSYLLLAFQQGDAAVRSSVVLALKQSGRDPIEAVRGESRALWSQLSKALTRGNIAERIAAAEGLGRSGRPEAVERLASYLGAESPPLALAASRGLGASGSPEARAPLEALLNDDSIDLRIAGAEALGKLGDAAAVPALARLVAEGGRPGMAAVGALEQLLWVHPTAGAHPDEKLLCAALFVDDEDLAASMASLVKRAKISCDVRPLLGRIQPSTASGRAALAAVGELGVEPASQAQLAKRLAEILRYGSPPTRPLAARVAGRLGISDLEPVLEKLLAEGGAQLSRARARWIPIAKSGGQNPVPESLFAEEPPELVSLQGETGLALVRLGGKSHLDIAAKMATDPSPVIRELAVEATLALPGSDGWPLLRGLLDDPQQSVNERAIAALGDFDRSSPEPARWLIAALQRGDARATPSTLVALLGKRPNTPDSVEVIAGELRKPETAGAAAEALGRGERSLVAPIVEARLAELPSAGLIELVVTSSEMNLKATLPSLQALRFHPRPEVAAAVAGALWKLDPEHAQGQLALLAEDYYLEVRRAAAGAPPG